MAQFPLKKQVLRSIGSLQAQPAVRTVANSELTKFRQLQWKTI
jgi:hypothetical protein